MSSSEVYIALLDFYIVILGGGSTFFFFFFFTEDPVYMQIHIFQSKSDFEVKQSPLCHGSAVKTKDTEVFQI